jgi:hypothetical protein
MGMKARLALAVVATAGLALAGGEVRAMSLENLNLVDLLRQSNSIVTGEVTAVTDGVDAQGVPYTEVTVAISETVRGEEEGTYTFHQYGLMNPRLSEDGTRVMLPAPESFPRYAQGEHVMLFLYKAASRTGLRTTTGLVQGKFTLEAGRAENGMANQGLFNLVGLSDAVTSDNIRRMLDTQVGAVSADTFTNFVRRAVAERWLENCTLWRTDQGTTCRNGRRRPATAVRTPGVDGDDTTPTTSSPTRFGR